jgi:Wadjet protein JetD, C-terminal
MPGPSRLHKAIAQRYEKLQAGRTGASRRDVLIPIEKLLEEADCNEGEKRALAERELQELQAAGVLVLEPVHKRNPSHVDHIRFSPENESLLYRHIGRPSPTQTRAALADQFAAAALAMVPDRWRGAWRAWCDRMSEAALAGRSVLPFDRVPCPENAQLLDLLPKLLAWRDESLVRFASCVLCGDSKKLEDLASVEREGEFSGKLRGKLGRVLSDVTGGAIQSLEDLGIIPNPRFALVQGPLRLRLEGQWLDLSFLHGPFRLAQADIERSDEIGTSARRCLTIENETSFHELAKLQSGELLVHTSYPGSGTLALLRRLPSMMEFWHFGDSDAAGFEILRVLREKSARDFRPLHMQRDLIPWEQESLGRPTRKTWPFYD